MFFEIKDPGRRQGACIRAALAPLIARPSEIRFFILLYLNPFIPYIRIVGIAKLFMFPELVSSGALLKPLSPNKCNYRSTSSSGAY